MKHSFLEFMGRKPWYFLAFVLCVFSCIVSFGQDAERIVTIKAYNVDADGKLYIGFVDRIEVFDNGIKLQSFSLPATYGKDYSIDVSEPSNIRVVILGVPYIVDQDGTVTEQPEYSMPEREDVWASLGDKTVGKTVYQKKGIIWPRIVIKGEKTIYWLPFVGVLIRIARVVGGFGFLAFIVAAVKTKSEMEA